MAEHAPRRNIVFRADGKMVNVPRKQGHLFVCSSGCCCGHTDRCFAPVPDELYHNEWEGRRYRNRVHLTVGGCLGPCTLANVAMLLFDGRAIWFHSINSEALVLALYDYIDQMLAVDAYLPPPPALSALHFTAFTWEERPDGQALDDAHRRRAVPVTPAAGFLFLTHADTDLLALEAARARLPADFPPVRGHSLLNLTTDADVDALLDVALPAAEVVILRLLGGRASFAHGFDRIVADVAARGAWLICLPGTDALDPELTAVSNAGVPVAHETFAYLQYGGVANVEQMLRFLADHLLATGHGYEPPAPQPRHGVYHPDLAHPSVAAWRARRDPQRPAVGLLFYRSHLLAGNTAFVDALVRAGERAGLDVLPVYAYSLKEDDGEGDGMPAALRLFLDEGGRPLVDTLISTMAFAMGGVSPDGPTMSGWAIEALERLDVPVLQAITAGGPRAAWEASLRGLSPIDAAMNIVLPEFDGRILTVPVSFKETSPAAQPRALATNGDHAPPAGLSRYVADNERADRLMGMAARLATLRHKPNAAKRIAVVLTNSTARISRIGNAVGLDAPASLLRLFEAMRAAGYHIEGAPATGDELLHALIDRCSYDVEFLTEEQLANAAGRAPVATYARWFADLPEKNRAEMTAKWHAPPGEAYVHDGHIALAGLEFGNVFVALQPPRGYGMDPNAIYHMPDLPPAQLPCALSLAARQVGADAVLHMGKHGTLEWLPASGGAVETCYPDQLLGDLPLVYPFIINNPGEKAQAKRRTRTWPIVDMTPPVGDSWRPGGWPSWRNW
ncbi:MAG: cobaltochelatase subunit CobN [Dehalococcoidia bacterium]